MAGRASFHDRIVPELKAGNGFREIFMAAETELVPREQQVVLVSGRVRVMAFDTVPFGHHLVGALRLLRNDSPMALVADPRGVRFQEFAVGGVVGIVAVGAVPGLHGSVDVGKLQRVRDLVVAIQAELSFRPRLQLELVLGKPLGDEEKRDDHKERKRLFRSRVHDFLPHFFSTMWHSSHSLPAKGGWTFSLKNFRSLETWGAWQLPHFIADASMDRCALANDSPLTLWHSPHNA